MVRLGWFQGGLCSKVYKGLIDQREVGGLPG